MNAKAVQAMREFLEALGLDLEREGMGETPERVAEMYGHLFSGMGRNTGDIWGKTFDAGSAEEGIVAVRHIPFYSICEHHLVPFFGEVHIAYLPAPGGVAGFSKFAELVELVARRPQLQERMTFQIAEAIARDLRALGVLVVVEARQLCMMMLEPATHRSDTVTNVALGKLREDSGLKAQAMAMLLPVDK